MPETENPTNTITHRVNGSVYDAISTAGQNCDYVVIGDTNHTDLSTRTFLSSPELISSLAAAGISHLCLEITPKHQHLADDLYNNRITKSQFETSFANAITLKTSGEVTEADFANSIANTIDYAKQAGIAVHFVDPSSDAYPTLSTPISQEIYNTAIEKYETETGLEPGSVRTIENAIYGLAYAAQQNHITADMYYKLRAELQINSRHHDDQTVDIIDRETNGEKTAVIYGAAHDNLATKLNGEVLVIDAYNNKTAVGNPVDGFSFQDRYRLLQNREDSSETAEGQPDIVHILGGDTYVTDQANPETLQGLNLTKVNLPNGPGIVAPLPLENTTPLPSTLPPPNS